LLIISIFSFLVTILLVHIRIKGEQAGLLMLSLSVKSADVKRARQDILLRKKSRRWQHYRPISKRPGGSWMAEPGTNSYDASWHTGRSFQSVTSALPSSFCPGQFKCSDCCCCCCCWISSSSSSSSSSLASIVARNVFVWTWSIALRNRIVSWYRPLHASVRTQFCTFFFLRSSHLKGFSRATY